MVSGRKGTHQAVLDEIQKSGFVRVRVNGQVHSLDEDIQMDRYKIHHIEAVVDRVVIRHYEDDEEMQNFRSRLTDSVETALQFGDGHLIVRGVIYATLNIWPARIAASACPLSSRAPSRSIPPTEHVPIVRALARA
jgi:excinuclease UvrABC ATPase subunit